MAKKTSPKWLIYMEYVPFYLLYKFMHMISLKTAYRLSGFLISILYYIDIRHRKRTISHLLYAGVARDRKEAAIMAKKTFQEFSKLLVEIVKMDQCYDLSKIKVIGPKETVDRVLSREHPNRNVIIATAHYGNWEVAGTAFSEYSRINMLSIMRPFDNPLVGELILAHRRSKVHELVDKRGSVRPVLKALQQGRNISILIDQHASHLEGVENVFFGHPCRTHMTPALLHLKTGVPILPELTRRAGDNFEFEIVVGDLIEYKPTGDKDKDVREITQLCTTALEKLIAQQPEQWMWAARRWLDIDRNKKK